MSNNNLPKYTYGPHGKGWAIYKMTYNGRFVSGDKIDWRSDREEAKKEVYRLNGWTYKESTNLKIKNNGTQLV